jgi:hypothetical protein
VSLGGLASALDTALVLCARGAKVIPVPRGKTAPVIKGWQKLRLCAADLAARIGPVDNLGVLLGEPSGGLVDVDLDAPEAIAVAQELLPATEMIHGRVSKPESHRWYIATPCPATTKFHDVDGKMLLEVRSTGGQTIVPPSRHPSGEDIVWERDGEPAVVAADLLQAQVADVAASALVAQHWPQEGTRQDAALALSGLLLTHGCSENRTRAIVRTAARAARDPEWQKREQAVAATAEKIAIKEAVTGGPTLEGLLTGDGSAVVNLLRKSLHLKGVPPVPEESCRPLLDAGELDLPAITPQAICGLAGCQHSVPVLPLR